MKETGRKSNKVGLESIGNIKAESVLWNLTPAELVEEALKNGEGVLSDTGALMCDTGKFTGRSPKDRFVVKDAKTADSVWWGDINIPFDSEKFDRLQEKMINFLEGKKIYVRDAYAGADPNYRLDLRIVNTQAWQNLFCNNMFLRPTTEEIENHVPNFTIICIPEFRRVSFTLAGGPVEGLDRLPGVRAIEVRADRAILTSDQPDATVAALVAERGTVADLEVTGAALTEAFLVLTSTGGER